VERDESAHEKFVGRVHSAASELAGHLGIEVELAEALVTTGMNSIEVIATLDASDIVDVLGIPAEEAAAIVAKAQAQVLPSSVQ
jgi:plasmid maintenance system antidote protein VapI